MNIPTAKHVFVTACEANAEAAAKAVNAAELEAFRQAAAFAADAFRRECDDCFTAGDSKLDDRVDAALDKLEIACGDFRSLHGETRYQAHRRQLADLGVIV